MIDADRLRTAVARHTRESGTAFVGALLAMAAVTSAGTALAPGVRVRTGQLVVDILGWALIVVAAVLWWRFRPTSRWNWAGHTFFAALLGAWVVIWISSARQGFAAETGIALVPVALVLLWTRRASVRDVVPAANGFAIAVLAICMATLLVDVVTSTDPSSAALPRVYEASQRYWLPLRFLPGLDGRWMGPAGHPNLTAAFGAYLVVYGAWLARGTYSRGPRGWALAVPLVAGGLVVLLATSSRTGWLAALAGVAVLAIVAAWRRASGRRIVLAASMIGLVVLTCAAALVLSPTLNGRLDIWPTYLRLWWQSPWSGAEVDGIAEALAEGDLPWWASHANQVFLDVLARNGGLAGACVLIAFVAAAALGWRSAVRASGISLALVATVTAGALTDVTIRWDYPAPIIVVLVLAVLLSEPDAPDDSTSLRSHA